jgi:hypothetical protein
VYRASDHITEFLKRDFSITVLVSLHNRLVDNLPPSAPGVSKSDLLKLIILQIIADHHFQHDKQFAIRNIAIPIHIINLERNYPSAISLRDGIFGGWDIEVSPLGSPVRKTRLIQR